MDWELEPSQAKGPSQVRGRGRPGVLGGGEVAPLDEELGPWEEEGRGGVHGHSASAGLPPAQWLRVTLFFFSFYLILPFRHRSLIHP